MKAYHIVKLLLGYSFFGTPLFTIYLLIGAILASLSTEMNKGYGLIAGSFIVDVSISMFVLAISSLGYVVTRHFTQKDGDRT